MPAPRSRFDRPRATRLFTDREQPIARFHAARAAVPADAPRLLVFYGIGGDGKTALCEELQRQLKAAEPRPPFGQVDFGTRGSGRG